MHPSRDGELHCCKIADVALWEDGSGAVLPEATGGARTCRRPSLAQRRGTALSLDLIRLAPSAPSAYKLMAADGYAIGVALGRGQNRGFRVLAAEQGGRKFAVKITEERAGEGTSTATLAEEYRLLRGLRHPHVVAANGFYESPHGCALLMERCHGQQLAGVLSLDGWLSIGDRWAVLDKILAAAAYLHSQGVAHRDLHAGNVMVDGSAEDGLLGVKIIDFGSARTTEALGSLLCEVGFEDCVSPSILPPQTPSPPCDALPFEASLSLDVYAAGLLAAGLLRGEQVGTQDLREVLVAELSALLGPRELRHGTRGFLGALLAPSWQDRPAASDAQRALRAMGTWSAA